MQWLNNNLIDDVNKYLVGYDAGGECCDWAEIIVVDSENNDITHDNLNDWEFIEFPYLDVEDGRDEVKIKNIVTGEIGTVVLESSNNGYYSACYWAHYEG